MTAIPNSPTVLFGGTFDPPHVAHLVLAECAMHQFGAGGVVFLPAGDPYRKRTGAIAPAREVTPAADRVAMVAAAIAANPAFVLDDRETRRAGPSYMVDTLEEYAAAGHADIVLLLGSDALADLRHWKAPERIAQLARVAAASKGGGPLPDPGVPGLRVEDVAMPPLAISSTLIRERLAAGLPARYLVGDAAWGVIVERGLYGVSGKA